MIAEQRIKYWAILNIIAVPCAIGAAISSALEWWSLAAGIWMLVLALIATGMLVKAMK